MNIFLLRSIFPVCDTRQLSMLVSRMLRNTAVLNVVRDVVRNSTRDDAGDGARDNTWYGARNGTNDGAQDNARKGRRDGAVGMGGSL